MRHQNRPVERNRARLHFRRDRRPELVGRRRHQLVPDFTMRMNGKAGERDEIVDIGDAVARAPRSRNPRIFRVGGPGQKKFERAQTAAALSGYVLAVDLLEAQDISIQPLKCRAEDSGAHVQWHAGLWRQLQALQIKGRDPHRTPSFSIPNRRNSRACP